MKSFGPLDELIDSHPDIRTSIDAEGDLLWDGTAKEPNYGVAAAYCHIAFLKGYAKRTAAENQQILLAVDKLFARYKGRYDTGIGYALDMAFGEQTAFDILQGKGPFTLRDLAAYPHLKASVEVMMGYMKKSRYYKYD